MSDFNAKIAAIDSAMDAVEHYQRELSDLKAHVTFDMRSLFDKLNQEIMRTRNEIEGVQGQIDSAQASVEADMYKDEPDCAMDIELEALYDKLWLMQGVLQDLEQVIIYCSDYGSDLLNQFLGANTACYNQSEDAIRFMGIYIHDINLICNKETNCLGTYRSAAGYYVCVVDSAQYPATAEHIRVAQNIGHPTRLTIDRSGASQRRTESLQNTPARREFDRDEYPMALFSEGGSGADVAHLEGADNRGAGSYVGWQLRGIPDGAEVRIRVI